MLPFLLKPYLKRVLWGGSSIAAFKGIDIPFDHVGESWEVSAMEGCGSVVANGPYAGTDFAGLCASMGSELLGKRIYDRYGGEFPILIKYIDAVGDLSVQVHPGDDIAYSRHGCRGKSEMWYIVGAEPGSRLSLGFSTEIDADEFESRVKDGTISDVLATFATHPGDVFYIPAGRVHAVGGGNFLVEVQLASDITYRIHDYNRRDKDGRLRELHIAEARDAIDYSVQSDYRSYPDGERLISSPFFSVDKISLSDDDSRTVCSDVFSVVMCIDGCIKAECEGHALEVPRGHTLFVPASTKVNLSGRSTLLLVVP